MSSVSSQSRRYLDPATLARVEGLEIRARDVVEGTLTGTHRSPYQGSSVEFAQHRQYSAGDDTRRVDWRVFARSDRVFIKQYEEETNLPIVLVVDASESMAFGTRPDDATWTKYEHAISLAATFAYIAHRQQDAVGIAVFDKALNRFVRPSNSAAQWRVIVEELVRSPRDQKTDTGAVLDQVAEKIVQRSLVIVLSDCFDDLANIGRGLKHLRYRKHEVAVLQTLDHAEVDFPYRDVTMFEGMEALGDLLIEPTALREAYVREMRAATAALAKLCRSLGADYHLLDTAEPIDVHVRQFLTRREGSKR